MPNSKLKVGLCDLFLWGGGGTGGQACRERRVTCNNLVHNSIYQSIQKGMALMESEILGLKLSLCSSS